MSNSVEIKMTGWTILQKYCGKTVKYGLKRLKMGRQAGSNKDWSQIMTGEMTMIVINDCQITVKILCIKNLSNLQLIFIISQPTKFYVPFSTDFSRPPGSNHSWWYYPQIKGIYETFLGDPKSSN